MRRWRGRDRLRPEPAPVGGGRRLEHVAEVQPQSRGGAQADGFGDDVDRVVRRFEASLRGEQALMGEPLVRRGAGLVAEAAGEGASRHGGARGEAIDGERLVQPALRPVEDARQTVRRLLSHRRRDVL
jgi:hypothetical protein